ncbi:MAG: WecB/TagA/CpsF family glycosyltransferase [Lachnospiraceae bacterium]|nr:WecB/TagA/CpsF family glycosyltransferase [Lachnospiraceae bacterium]
MKGIKSRKIFGLPLALSTPEKAVDHITEEHEKLGGKYVTFCNVHTLMTARNDAAYAQAQKDAYLRMPDGKPLAWCLKGRGYREASQVAGPDFMQRMLRLPAERNGKHYFYGASETTLRKLEEVIRSNYPDAQIAGMESPPFRELTEEEEKEALQRMNDSGADYIWIGLGAPKQEYFMQRNAGRARGIMFGVGAAFDFHAGRVDRAPKWLRRIGLEWLFRLLQDPQRLWKRYLMTNTQFLLLLPGYFFHAWQHRKNG